MKRGHRLVADDCVEIRQEDQDTLVGNAPELIEHLLEIRGLGIINVMTLFGAGAVRSRSPQDYPDPPAVFQRNHRQQGDALFSQAPALFHFSRRRFFL